LSLEAVAVLMVVVELVVFKSLVLTILYHAVPFLSQ
jgi:hypothetical protein